MKKNERMRLDRFLSNLGYGSRREVQSLIRSGAVALDGKIIDVADDKIAIDPDLCERMTVDGERLDPLPGVVIMMNKPLGVTCSHSEIGKLVYDLLPDRWRGRDPVLSTVGRLDKDTSGLLLMTDDGDLIHRIISPRSHVPKRYLVTLEKPLQGNEGALFASGTMMLEEEDKPLLPAMLDVLTPLTCRLTITEGRYHQVRRMFAAVGNHVTALHRESVGGLFLPEALKSGEYRILDQGEIDKIVLAKKS